MSQISISIHMADGYNPTRVFFSLQNMDGFDATAKVHLIQNADDQLVTKLRAAADELEVTLAKDKKKADAEARVKALMEAEA